MSKFFRKAGYELQLSWVKYFLGSNLSDVSGLHIIHLFLLSKSVVKCYRQIRGTQPDSIVLFFHIILMP